MYSNPPLKSLGQNFLKDQNIISKILNLVDIKPEDNILELGCGPGALTKEIIKHTDNFMGIEKDIRLFESLKSELGEKFSNKIILGDMLRVSFNETAKKMRGKIKLVGNLPYNISSQVVFKIIDEYLAENLFDSAFLMFQKEVADRLCSREGLKDYGILSVLLRYVADAKSEISVSPFCFYPKPKVYSSVVKCVFREYPKKANDVRLLKNVVKSAFNQRRKKINNSLKPVIKDPDVFKEIISKCGLTGNERAEDLSLDNYIDISNNLIMLKG
jgi:16S rRNA (adenine1518-N6/adenine1519-N6)-dimethyltransferase